MYLEFALLKLRLWTLHYTNIW